MNYNFDAARPTASVTLITGERSSGKSTLCYRLYRRAVELGNPICGVVSVAVYDSLQEKIGFDALNLDSQRSAPLARKDGTLVGSRWACYTFSDDVVNECVSSTVAALDNGVDLLVLDEIGPLELTASRGFLPILKYLESSGLPSETYVVVRPSLAAELERFFQSCRTAANLRSVQVTTENRDSLARGMASSLAADGSGAD